MKIVRAKDHRKSPNLKVCVYGHTGTGKTSWAAQAPKPLVVLTEVQGMASIGQFSPDANVAIVNTWKEFSELFDRVKRARPVVLDGVQTGLELQNSDVVFQTLVLDSFTDLQVMMMNEIMAGKVKDPFDLANMAKLTLQQWGRLQEVMAQVLRAQRAIACSTVFICLAREEYDDKQRRRVLPLLSGRMIAPTMGQYFNAVGYTCTHTDGTPIIWWKQNSTFISKQFPGFPGVTKTREVALGSLMLKAFLAGSIEDEEYLVPHNAGDTPDIVTEAFGQNTGQQTGTDEDSKPKRRRKR